MTRSEERTGTEWQEVKRGQEQWQEVKRGQEHSDKKWREDRNSDMKWREDGKNMTVGSGLAIAGGFKEHQYVWTIYQYIYIFIYIYISLAIYISIRYIEESMYMQFTQCDVLSQGKHIEIISTPAWSTPFHSPDTLDYKTHSAAACSGSRTVLIWALMDWEGSMLWDLILL